MATKLQTLYVEFGARTEGYKRGLREVENVTEKTTKSVQRGSALMTAAWAAAGAAALSFGQKAIKAASDAQETFSKFQVVFGANASEVDEWAKTTADALGRSQFAFRRYLSTLQDTFVPMGVARDEAAELSKAMTTLAVDVGSFNNLPTDQVVRDFQSALVGNTETVRKYGVVISQTRLNQELLNQGIEGGVKAATEAEKIQARVAIIMSDTADAQGDAARTADSYANRLVRLQSEFEKLTVEIGQELLPAATSIVEQLTTLVTLTRAFANSEVVSFLTKISDIFWDIDAAIRSTVVSLSSSAWRFFFGSNQGPVDLSPIPTRRPGTGHSRRTGGIGGGEGGDAGRTRINSFMQLQADHALRMLEHQIDINELLKEDGELRKMSAMQSEATLEAWGALGQDMVYYNEETLRLMRERGTEEEKSLARDLQRNMNWENARNLLDSMIAPLSRIVADFENWDTITESLESALKRVASQLLAMAAQLAALSVLNSLTGGGLGSFRSILGFVTGFRQHGGPVRAGGAYVVGERGPELFQPHGTGHISAQMGAPTVVLQGNLSVRMDEIVFALENHDRRYNAQTLGGRAFG